DFPNCFLISNVQSGFTANYPHMLDAQSKHLSYVIAEAQNRQARTVETSAEAEENWIKAIEGTAMLRAKFQEECTPGYYNNEGQPSPLAVRNGSYGAGSIAFMRMLEEWRAEGTLKGLKIE
ncbi:MAG: monooxygenase, partial [Caulobacteraceae bacterium]